MRAAVTQTVSTFGGIDILVNNAGVAINAPLDDYKFEDYERMVAVNVTGVFVATQEAARHMTPGGRIIHIGSSMTRYAAFRAASVYTLTKGAITGFIDSTTNGPLIKLLLAPISFIISISSLRLKIAIRIVLRKTISEPNDDKQYTSPNAELLSKVD